MEGDPKFTLFWRDGKRQVIQGRSISEAFALAGYSGGALRALDFYAEGDRHDYQYNAADRGWDQIEAPAAQVSATNSATADTPRQPTEPVQDPRHDADDLP